MLRTPKGYVYPRLRTTALFGRQCPPNTLPNKIRSGITLHTHTQHWSIDWNRGAAACLERALCSTGYALPVCIGVRGGGSGRGGRLPGFEKFQGKRQLLINPEWCNGARPLHTEKSTKSKGSSPAESTNQTDTRWRRAAMWREGLKDERRNS